MTNVNEIYKCNICGNVVSVIDAGQGSLVCCGEEMEKIVEKSADKEGKEKHIPVITIVGNVVTVKVGSIPHPMEEKHYISLIQVMKGKDVLVGKRLKPGDAPEAVFTLNNTDGIWAREFCNIHGLWKSN